MPIADTVVSALDFHVEGRRLDSRVCAFHSLVLCDCVGDLCDCGCAYSGAVARNLREGECSGAGPYLGIQWCMVSI